MILLSSACQSDICRDLTPLLLLSIQIRVWVYLMVWVSYIELADLRWPWAEEPFVHIFRIASMDGPPRAASLALRYFCFFGNTSSAVLPVHITVALHRKEIKSHCIDITGESVLSFVLPSQAAWYNDAVRPCRLLWSQDGSQLVQASVQAMLHCRVWMMMHWACAGERRLNCRRGNSKGGQVGEV